MFEAALDWAMPLIHPDQYYLHCLNPHGAGENASEQRLAQLSLSGRQPDFHSIFNRQKHAFQHFENLEHSNTFQKQCDTLVLFNMKGKLFSVENIEQEAVNWLVKPNPGLLLCLEQEIYLRKLGMGQGSEGPARPESGRARDKSGPPGPNQPWWGRKKLLFFNLPMKASWCHAIGQSPSSP